MVEAVPKDNIVIAADQENQEPEMKKNKSKKRKDSPIEELARDAHQTITASPDFTALMDQIHTENAGPSVPASSEKKKKKKKSKHLLASSEIVPASQ